VIEGSSNIGEKTTIDDKASETNRSRPIKRRIHILTGPNGAGKSVYLKMVGSIVVLAHAGCFVPAESAKIGIVDRVSTRMLTRESSSTGRSAFETDVLQMDRAIRICTSQSLVLVDEFGKGTAPSDGAAMFAAAIRSLNSMGESAPRTIAVTHFYEATKYYDESTIPSSKNIGTSRIKWLSMDVLGGELEAEDDCVKFPSQKLRQQLIYLYRVINGRPPLNGSSAALHCASMAGIPTSVIQRAKNLLPMFEAGVTPAAIRYANVPKDVVSAAESTIDILLEGSNSDKSWVARIAELRASTSKLE
jgi:DNA mismatch repair protein MSH5